MGADEVVTSVKNIGKPDRSRTPNEGNIQIANLLEKPKSVMANRGVLLKVKMTKDEHDEYAKKEEKMVRGNIKPATSNALPTNSAKKPVIKSKRL